MRTIPVFLMALGTALALSGWAHAQEKPFSGSDQVPAEGAAPERTLPKLELDTIVVTATANPITRIRSSASGSVLYPEDMAQSAPSNAADILRNVPGILSQASGGEGNANLSARGLPQTGGAKLMQFQEDGLPVLEFGDINFSTADTFLRADYNVDRLEVIRGGSAATFASNAPGGVINFISKTGEVAGGAIALSRGVDFDRTRVDFDYGKPVSDEWRFHLGGFYRVGEGPRTVGYTAESGGQLKGNVTRDFGNGYVRLNFKILEDRTPVYLPEPISITGTNSNPDVTSLSGFDVRHGAMQSRYFLRDVSVDKDGNTVVTDIADGYYASSQAFGGEAAFKLDGGWKIEDRFRIAATSGRFVGPYPAEVATAGTLATEIGGPGASLRYATGPQTGQPFTDGNGLAVRTHLFNTTLNDMGNFANDFKLTKFFKSDAGSTTAVTLGYYRSRQAIVQDWHWNTYLEEVKGKNAALLDVVDANGNLVTQNGLVAYGEPYWDNCCVRSLDVRYRTDAPYLSTNWEKGPFNVDGSLRYDTARAVGHYASNSGTRVLDVNHDGVIQVPERTVPVVDPGTTAPVDYVHSYLSYSFGLNYLLRRDLAVFARVGQGGRANADRLLFGGGIQPNGDVPSEKAINKVRQVEGGLKWRGRDTRVFATLFHATTKEVDQDITIQTFYNRIYTARGLELEGGWYQGPFSLSGGLTYTHSEIQTDELTPERVGEQVNPRLVTQVTMAYQGPKLGTGINVIGTSAYPQEGGISLPGFAQVNVFATYQLAKDLSLGLVGHNIFNTIGLTEAPNGPAGVTADGLNTARSINGRSFIVSLRYTL